MGLTAHAHRRQSTTPAGWLLYGCPAQHFVLFFSRSWPSVLPVRGWSCQEGRPPHVEMHLSVPSDAGNCTGSFALPGPQARKQSMARVGLCAFLGAGMVLGAFT